MNTATEPSSQVDTPDTLSSTAPEGFSVLCRAFASEEQAYAVGNAVGRYVRILGRDFNLSRLDGVTVAYDYHKALEELERGYPTSHRLTPSAGDVVGIGMTPSVVRDGALMSRIVLNAQFVAPIADDSNPNFQQALHLLAHECAHVEITHKFDQAFPGTLLRNRYDDIWKACRGQVIMACWDEYAASKLSACYGKDCTQSYEETFTNALATARNNANGLIKAYRIHGDVSRALFDVYGSYGNLLKLSAYHLGNLDGHGLCPAQRPNTVNAIAGHWFAPCFERLRKALQAISKDYGHWPDFSAFEVIGDIADDVVAGGGLKLRYTAPKQVYVDIPFSLETLPSRQV